MGGRRFKLMECYFVTSSCGDVTWIDRRRLCVCRSAPCATPQERLWKRWQSCGLLALAHVGYLGVTDPGAERNAIATCMVFHSLAGVAVMWAYKEGGATWNEAVSTNLHMYLGMGFASVHFGLLE